MQEAIAQAAPENNVERAGSTALAVFARVLNAEVLRAHASGPISAAALEDQLGWAAPASLRVASANMCDLGALKRDGQRVITTDLTQAGHDLLGVADALEAWLARSPFGPLSLSGQAAQGTVRALVAGWDSGIVRAVAERPLRLAELSPEIATHSYPALKRRFAKLRTATLVESVGEGARSPEYETTPLLRHAAGPLALAARWERDHLGTCLEEEDLESILLLALPLVELPRGASGSCVLTVARPRAAGKATEPSPTAINLEIEDGKIARLNLAAAPSPKTWAVGTADAWLAAVIDARTKGLRLRGPDAKLLAVVLAGLNHALF